MGCSNSTDSAKPPACSGSISSCSAPDRLGHQAFHGKYVLGKKLGQGSYGQVRAASLRPPKPEVGTDRKAEGTVARATPTHAVKIIELRGKDGSADEQILRKALAEDEAWRAAGKHENILGLLDSYIDTGAHKMAYFVMDFCLECLLDDKNRHLLGNAAAFIDIAQGMRSGLAHLHGLAIAHRDVKPDNFVLGADGTTVKLCDFGMAAVVPKEGLRGVFGTAPYMAPEMLAERRYGVSVDIWAYGVTCYVLMLGDFPYKPAAGVEKSSAGFKQAIKDGKEPPYTPADKTWSALRPRAEQFLRALLIRDAQTRPVLEDLEGHAFFCERPAVLAMPATLEKVIIQNANDDDTSTTYYESLNASDCSSTKDLLPVLPVRDRRPFQHQRRAKSLPEGTPLQKSAPGLKIELDDGNHDHVVL